MLSGPSGVCAPIKSGECALSVMSTVRSRAVSTLAILALIGAALFTVPALASAAPYPPSNPPSSGVAPTSAHRDASGHRDTNTNRHTSETASTGFATLSATAIAIALLGGGVALVVAGRRRRHG